MATSGHARIRSLPDWNRRLRDILPRSSSHARVQSLSTASNAPNSSRPDLGLRSQSVPSLADMAATLAPTPVPHPAFPLGANHDMESSVADSSISPTTIDVGSEVTALSNKLIAAINHQTSLDDSLAAARLELEQERERASKLEASNKEYKEMMENGTLVKRQEIESENVELREALEEERQKRATVEKERKSIEQELENLTTALFEEANQMVAAARHERDLTERKNEQLRNQLKDTENLLASHQQQLAELKTVMQQMSSDRDENETNTNLSTAPTTPLLGTHEHLGKLFDALHLCPNTPGSDDIPPSYPTSFSHLLQPVLRADLPAYQDFSSLLKTSRMPPTRNRSSTGTYSGLSLSLGSLRESSPWHSSASPVPSNGSSPSWPTNTSLASSSSSPATPPTPTASQGNPLGKDVVVPLKDTRFYKRVLLEDIEPTLRLDIAPGLSWLARRTVAASMSEGNLVVEPFPPAPSIRVVTCALCGERRRGEQYARTHQLKANDNETAQRYPLCKYCTGRVRATCDFLGFLRMVKDGHWRADGEEGEKSAWEESVRLRDRMFWARIGGGVVPAFVQVKESPRPSSAESEAEKKKKKSRSDGGHAEAQTSRESVTPKAGDEDIFRSTEKRVSIGSTVICVEPRPSTEGTVSVDGDVATDPVEESESTKPVETAIRTATVEDAPQSASATLDGRSSPAAVESTGRTEQRLSITIPGAFDETP